MRKVLLGILIGILGTAGAFFARREMIRFIASASVISPIGKIIEKPLEKYTINALGGKVFTGSRIILDEPTATTSAYTVYPFHFDSDGPTSSRDAGLRGVNKKVTGVAHIPNDATPINKKPVIVQFRGFIDPQEYIPGMGTRHSAEVFAANGFISLAPDFFGFGGSDMPSEDVFEERFETYTTALNLIASVATLPTADPASIGIWGHSNGGQIALTVLESVNRAIPASLWAPVSKPFPYSILYYTDEFEDHGRQLRRVLAAFEENYNVELYSTTNYLDRITGPVQIHQGTADDAVPLAWSDAFAKTLTDSRKDATSASEVKYFTYPGADHDMNGAWNTVIVRDVEFFKRNLTR